MNDTIVAISTALGVGAISIVRLSGPSAIDIASKIFEGKNLSEVESHTIHYGHIKYKDELIDEVLVSVMKSPKTFTTEDIVEINCHGGITTTNKILEILLLNGARLAEPGEFTKRAFLNGRIDLIEAEATMDLIQVKNEQARSLAMNGLTGSISKMIESLREKIVEILANIEVNIDYPEYEDIEIMTNEKILPKLKTIKQDLVHIIKESENGQIIKDGIKTIIIGRPNVGKSSILNRLLDEEKAIVTDIAGTTRDIVEGTINLDGILLNMIDTAGIRKTDNIVEKIGVDKSLNLIPDADLVLIILNRNNPLTEEDKHLLDITKKKKSIVVLNKNDLENKIDKKKLEDRIVVETNTKEYEGISSLKEKIKELFNLNQLEKKDYNYLSNVRQITLAKESLQKLEEVEKSITQNIPIDMIELDIKEAWNLLGKIIGAIYEEELLDQLFSRFCVGK